MPGHFTHVYTARRLADWLGQQDRFNPNDTETRDLPGIGALTGGVSGLTPHRCSEVMKKWPKYTNVGAIGPDLFFFCQDYSGLPFAASPYACDTLMLAMAVYYWADKAKDEDWEPLLAILAEVDQTFANVVRVLIKLDKAWHDFVKVWDATIGPVVSAADASLDALTGGVVSAAGAAIGEFGAALKLVVEQELATYKDVFSWFSLKMRAGYDEHAFLWSDMLHYRKTNQMARNLLAEAERQFAQDKDQDKLEQFQAFALGWIAHIGTDVIAHSYVNEQAGGPFRTHWQRHHVVENHIDAWNYRQARADGTGALPADDLAANDVYPDLSRSAFVYAVALDEENPDGWTRPETLPDGVDAAKAAVDQDGFMPGWLAEGIVRALIATYHHEGEVVPTNLAGGDFQTNGLGAVRSGLENVLNVAGIDLNRPLDDVIAQVAPAPDFDVPPGFPLPWEVAVSYRFMISYYRLAFWGGFDLDKPRQPSVIEWPPASDLSDLASAPDLSGVNSGDPVEDVCAAILALIQWIVKEVSAVVQLVADIVKAVTSPLTYPIRWALYQLAMLAWDMVNSAHDILAHTGFVLPHGELRYDDGELRQADEIDAALIQLGNTVDAAFLQALADAVDPFGNLDGDPALMVPQPNPRTERYPFFPVRPKQDSADSPNEYRRPWAYPDRSRRDDQTLYATPTELSDVVAELKANHVDPKIGEELLRILGTAPIGTVSGPYPAGAMPHQVLFRTDRPVVPQQRTAYENAVTPAHTDAVNERVIGRAPDHDHSPLGDPIPFSAYLMGRIVDPADSVADFNLDADRGYGYRCWDWVRGTSTGQDPRGDVYPLPVDPPEGSGFWPGAEPPNQGLVMLRYVDPAATTVPPPSNHGPAAGAGADGPRLAAAPAEFAPAAAPAPAPAPAPAAEPETWEPPQDPNSHTIWTGRP